MKKKFDLVLGCVALLEVVYKLFTCPTCEDSILWFEVPGWGHILFWGVAASALFYNVYKANWGQQEKELKS